MAGAAPGHRARANGSLGTKDWNHPPALNRQKSGWKRQAESLFYLFICFYMEAFFILQR